jgi:branched-chain amino acid transport system permease protein
MFIPATIGFETLTTGLTLGALYALIAVGLTMVYGMLRILHIAHAAVLVIGAYSGFFTWSLTGNVWIAIPIAMAVSALLNVVLYQLLYRRIVDEEPLIPLIASIALYIALSDSYRLLFGPFAKNFQADFALPVTLPGFAPAQTVIISLTLVLFAGLLILVNFTNIGIAWQVTAQDRDTAASLGINVNRITAVNFAVGGLLAGVAGVMVGTYYGSVSPSMGNVWAYKTFVIIVLGGMGNVRGTILAAFVLGLSETLIISQWGYIIPRDAIAFSLMVLVLMFKPEGLFSGRNDSILRTAQRRLSALFGPETPPTGSDR